MATILGPEDFYFDAVNTKDGDEDIVVVQFGTKASIDANKRRFLDDEDERLDADTNLSDFLFNEDNIFEVDELEYESDLTVEETIKHLVSLGFKQATIPAE